MPCDFHRFLCTHCPFPIHSLLDKSQYSSLLTAPIFMADSIEPLQRHHVVLHLKRFIPLWTVIFRTPLILSYDSNFGGVFNQASSPWLFHNLDSLGCTLNRSICSELWSVVSFLSAKKNFGRGHLLLFHYLWTFQFVAGTGYNWIWQLY